MKLVQPGSRNWVDGCCPRILVSRLNQFEQDTCEVEHELSPISKKNSGFSAERDPGLESGEFCVRNVEVFIQIGNNLIERLLGTTVAVWILRINLCLLKLPISSLSDA